VDKLSAEAAAAKFHYSPNTLYSLRRDLRANRVELFPSAKKKGPKQRRTPDDMQTLVVDYRQQGLTCVDVAEKLTAEGYKISTRTVENIVLDFNLPRLPRRTKAERGVTQRNEWIALKATPIDFQILEPFQMDSPVAGVFFFHPYLIEPGIIDIIKICHLPTSSAINAAQACWSMLLLKLIGNKRLRHRQAYDHEPTLGLIACLNLLTWPGTLAEHQRRWCGQSI